MQAGLGCDWMALDPETLECYDLLCEGAQIAAAITAAKREADEAMEEMRAAAKG